MIWTTAILEMGALLLAATSGLVWHPIGPANHVTLGEAGAIKLHVDEPMTAGQVSSVMTLPAGCDAVMVTAELADAEAQTVTFAVHDALTGEPIGYWQNPTNIDTPTREAAVMDLLRPARQVRLFIGTDGQASSASVNSIQIAPLCRTGAYHSVQYGTAVTHDKTVGQSFTATGTQFGGLTVRVRFARSLDAPPLNLTARLFEWRDNTMATRSGEVLATVTIPGQLIPAGSRGNERDLMLPLDASLTPGKLYFVEIAMTGDPTSHSDVPCLLFAGSDGLAGGEMYQNDRTRGWGLHTTLYQER